MFYNLLQEYDICICCRKCFVDVIGGLTCMSWFSMIDHSLSRRGGSTMTAKQGNQEMLGEIRTMLEQMDRRLAAFDQRQRTLIRHSDVIDERLRSCVRRSMWIPRGLGPRW